MNQKSKILGVSKAFFNTYENAWLNNQKLPIEGYNKLYCVDKDKYLALDNSTGNCWAEEFKTLKEAKDWLILDEIEYMKKYGNEYKIKFWETEEDRDRGESSIYPKYFNNKEESIKEAKILLRREDYDYVEVYDMDNELIFSSDGLTENYSIGTIDKDMIL